MFDARTVLRTRTRPFGLGDQTPTRTRRSFKNGFRGLGDDASVDTGWIGLNNFGSGSTDDPNAIPAWAQNGGDVLNTGVVGPAGGVPSTADNPALSQPAAPGTSSTSSPWASIFGSLATAAVQGGSQVGAAALQAGRQSAPLTTARPVVASSGFSLSSFSSLLMPAALGLGAYVIYKAVTKK